MNKIAEEINELLQEKESVSVSELTNIYELFSIRFSIKSYGTYGDKNMF